jgi:hypothetical protein
MGKEKWEMVIYDISIFIISSCLYLGLLLVSHARDPADFNVFYI